MLEVSRRGGKVGLKPSDCLPSDASGVSFSHKVNATNLCTVLVSSKYQLPYRADASDMTQGRKPLAENSKGSRRRRQFDVER